MTQRVNILALAWLALTAALFGSAFTSIKVLAQDIHPVVIAAGRVSIAAVILCLLFLRQPRTQLHSREEWWAMAGVGSLGIALPFVLIPWAEQFMSSAEAGALFIFGPWAGLVITHLMNRDDGINSKRVLGLAIGLVATVGLVWQGNVSTQAPWSAQAAILISAGCYAVAGNLVRRLVHTSITAATAVSFVIATLLLWPIAFWADGARTVLRMTQEHVVALGYLGVCATALAYSLRFWQAHRFGYTFASFTGYLVPPFAALWGYLLLGETLNPGIFLVVGVVLAGAMLAGAARSPTTESTASG